MDRFDESTPLWDYQDNSVPGGEPRPRRSRRDREYAARAYTLVEDDAGRRPYRDHAYRRDNWEDDRFDDPGAFRGRESDWPHYERSDRRQRYYDAVREARSADYDPAGGWPAELGYPRSPGYSPYGRYGAASRPASRHDEDRGFFERAGDELRSWLGDQDARRRRERDHRGRGPKSYVRSDERIREDVNDRLTDDVWLDASEIEVTVERGEVTLAGSVEGRRAKRRAEDLADTVSGVRHVQNNLRYGMIPAAEAEG